MELTFESLPRLESVEGLRLSDCVPKTIRIPPANRATHSKASVGSQVAVLCGVALGGPNGPIPVAWLGRATGQKKGQITVAYGADGHRWNHQPTDILVRPFEGLHILRADLVIPSDEPEEGDEESEEGESEEEEQDQAAARIDRAKKPKERRIGKRPENKNKNLNAKKKKPADEGKLLTEEEAATLVAALDREGATALAHIGDVHRTSICSILEKWGVAYVKGHEKRKLLGVLWGAAKCGHRAPVLFGGPSGSCTWDSAPSGQAEACHGSQPPSQEPAREPSPSGSFEEPLGEPPEDFSGSFEEPLGEPPEDFSGSFEEPLGEPPEDFSALGFIECDFSLSSSQSLPWAPSPPSPLPSPLPSSLSSQPSPPSQPEVLNGTHSQVSRYVRR
jgi:hypothetical protein